ncbi:MAG: response regulator [Desulfobacterales bacterium]|nr:response regulator [Desulfobacterales bacterium]
MAKILILNDQPYIRELLSEVLTYEGFEIVSVGNVELMWECFNESPPNLVLLDLYLYGRMSWKTFLDIKQKFPNIPVLFTTAYESLPDDLSYLPEDVSVINIFFAFEKLKRKIIEILGSTLPLAPISNRYYMQPYTQGS